MGFKQELEAARTAVGTALHNANTALTELGLEPAATVAALPPCITAAHAAGEEAGRQAENDRFWKVLQHNGRRTYYDYAFYGAQWGDGEFTPRFNMSPRSASYMFGESNISDLVGILEARGIILDFSTCINLRGVASGSSITRFPTIAFNNTNTFTEGFKGSQRLTDVKFVGTQEVISWHNAFYNCTSLTNLTVEVVIDGTFNVSWSPKLTHESLLSILGALKDRSTSTPLVCTLGATNLAKLSNTEKAIATGKGWTLA